MQSNNWGGVGGIPTPYKSTQSRAAVLFKFQRSLFCRMTFLQLPIRDVNQDCQRVEPTRNGQAVKNGEEITIFKRVAELSKVSHFRIQFL
jgi:hypothetical protein